MRAKGIIRDERGITTVGMAVSLLLCLSLLFSGAQLYRVGSAASEVQEVADAAALAAEAEVAEFMIAVRTCDAALLSMTLLAGTAYGIGLVAACVPPAAPLSESLISLGSKVVKARNDFADAAEAGLNRLQKMLPFLAAASAQSVASACNAGAMDADYYAIGVLLPTEGAEIRIGASERLSELAERVEADAQGIRDDAAAAEEAAKKAAEAKQEAFMHDCGLAPGYCQYERAGRGGWMPTGANPSYASVDAWAFSVALQRAHDYYVYRSENETLPSGGIEEMASYRMRQAFYDYAAGKLEREGYVREGEGAFEANFPKLFRNVNEFRQSELYETATFPVSADEVMHADTRCPAFTSYLGHHAISCQERGSCKPCPTCNLTVESFGNVASASTNIANGFEYHYERIRQAAIAYQEARAQMDPLVEQAKGKASPLLEAIGALIDEVGAQRIDAAPPGSAGAICIVANARRNAADAGFESLFVSDTSTLGARAAVSAAALVEDASDDNANVITSLLDGFDQDGGAAVGGARILLDCWSGLLKAYEKGHAALADALERGLDSFSTGTLSGLGAWAEGALGAAVEAAGLEPAKLNALKPAILNTKHVAGADDGAFAVRFRDAKAQALALSAGSGGLLAKLAETLPEAIEQRLSETTITIAEIEFPVGGASIPLKIALPPAVTEAAGGFVERCVEGLRGVVESATGVRRWE